MTSLDELNFGPFSTIYHQHLVDNAFKKSARQFIADNLLPQVDHDIVAIDGSLTPRATEEINCGPNSGIRNCFFLDIRVFGRSSLDHSELKTQLWYRPDSAKFQVASQSSLYVWTPKRRKERELQKTAIQQMIDSILAEQNPAPFCPICFSTLSVVNRPDLFHAACPNKCFRYNFHKDESGRLLHGHFNMFEPKT